MNIDSYMTNWKKLYESILEEGSSSEYQKAYLSMKNNPQNFFSTNRTIDLDNDAIEIPYEEKDFKFNVTTDLFKDVTENIQIQFCRPDEKRFYYFIKIKIPSINKEYSFFPTPIDLIRIINSMRKSGIQKELYVAVTNQCFDMAEQIGVKIFRNAVYESQTIVEDESARDRVDVIIQRELSKIEKGEFEFSHQNTKIDRVNNIPKVNGKFVYGNLILGYKENAKARGYKYSMVYLSDEAIEFIFDENVRILRSVSFKDPYGIGKIYERQNVNVVPMDVLLKSIENQSSGKSTLDNETSKI